MKIVYVFLLFAALNVFWQKLAETCVFLPGRFKLV